MTDRYGLRELSDYSSLVLSGPTSLVFIGALDQGSWHSHSANVYVVALERPAAIRLQGGSGWVQARRALIPATVSHRLDPRGGVCAVIYVDLFAPTWSAMAPLNSSCIEAHDSLPTALTAPLLEMYTAELQDTRLTALKQALDEALGVPNPVPLRVLPVIRHMQRAIAEQGDCSLDAQASQACLSASRLQHLFLEELGVGFKKVQLWLRFRAAVQSVADGQTVTDAALACGFAGSSHFSHAFRSMFGVSLRHALLERGGFRFLTTDW